MKIESIEKIIKLIKEKNKFESKMQESLNCFEFLITEDLFEADHCLKGKIRESIQRSINRIYFEIKELGVEV